MTQPFDRLESETVPAFAAFCEYRDLGPDRSLLEAWRKRLEHAVGSDQATPEARDRAKRILGRPSLSVPGNWTGWSTRQQWVARAAAYDEYLDKAITEKLAAGIVRMRERHAALAESMIRKLEERLAALDPATIKAEDLPRWLEAAVKVERLARGEAGDVVKQEHSGPNGGPIPIGNADLKGRLKELSVEDLEALVRIADAMEGASNGAGLN